MCGDVSRRVSGDYFRQISRSRAVRPYAMSRLIYLCIFAFLAGIALFASDRLAMSRPRRKGVGGALAQGVPPLIALTAALL
jgi:putative membrane protein